MPYAIHLFFDTETDQAILSIWQEMVDSGVAPYLGVSGNRPHISLALCEEFNQATCQKQMEDWSIQAKPFPISFQSLGIFPAPDAVVFTAPVVTQDLLALQREVDGMLDGCCKWPEFDYYRPGHWIPHCTLATGFEEKRLSEVLAIAARLKLPLNGMACGVGVIEFRPVKNLFGVSFGK